MFKKVLLLTWGKVLLSNICFRHLLYSKITFLLTLPLVRGKTPQKVSVGSTSWEGSLIRVAFLLGNESCLGV